MNEHTSENERDTPQFSLGSLLLFTISVAVYAAITMAAVRQRGHLFDHVLGWSGRDSCLV